MNKLFSSRKGEMGMTIDALPAFAITFLVVGLVIAVAIQINGDVKTDLIADGYDNTSEEYQALDESTNAMSKLASKQGLLATVVVAAILIGVVVGAFAVFGRKN